ncbi:MAG: sulfite exporter TauE/SafE family protein [Peptococcaceae bacterium]|nr:sulfite exporter TauE/SafE family protein [Peptococcaceae bacterium]
MVHMPVAGVDMAWWPLVLIGFCVGVIGGYFGIGGAFMVTPSLNIFGFPMAYAVGTDQAHLAGKSIVATFRHWKFGHVSVVIAFTFIIGTFAGVEVGAQTLMWLTKKGIAGPVVRWIYIALLGGLAIWMFYDYFIHLRSAKQTGQNLTDKVGTKLSDWVQKKLDVPPLVYCKVTRIRISAWAIIFIACITGLIAGILGVGGGFFRVPCMVYVLGMPTKIAVGTDLFEIVMSGAYGGLSYGMKGAVELMGAALMLCGAAVGAQIGTLTTKYVFGFFIRLLLATTVALACVSVALKQVAYYFEVTYAKEFSALLTSKLGLKAAEVKAVTGGALTAQKKALMYQYMVEKLNRPDFFDAFSTNYLLTNLSQYIMLGSAVGLSAFLCFLCIRGILRERNERMAAIAAHQSHSIE